MLNPLKLYKKNLSSLFILFFIFLLTSSCINNAQLKIKGSQSNETPTDNQTSSTASSLIFKVEPGGGGASTAWSQQPVVSIWDSAGQKVLSGPDAFALITLTISSGTGTLLGTTSAYAVLGEASFTNLNIDLLGNKKITATKADTSLYGGSISYTAESDEFTISALGSASQIKLSSASTIISPSSCQLIQLNFTDAGGNLVNISSNTVVNISNLMSAAIYSNSTCTTTLVSPVTISAGLSTYNFYIKDDGQESVRLSASVLSSSMSPSNLDLNFSQLHINKLFMSANGDVLCKLFTTGKAMCESSSANDFGQAGYLNSSNNPKILSFNSPIVDMALSENSSCALLLDSSVHCWGLSNLGTRGDGGSTFGISLNPSTVLLPAGGVVSQIVAVQSGTCALVTVSSVPSVYCWGDITNFNSSTPALLNFGLTAGQSILKIKSSWQNGIPGYGLNAYNSIFVILNDGTVKTRVQGGAISTYSGLTNVKDITRQYIGTPSYSIDNFFDCIIHINNTVSCAGILYTGNLNSPPGPVSGFSSIDTLNTTQHSVMALKNDGSVLLWGKQFGGNGKSFSYTTPTLSTNLSVTKVISSSLTYCGILSTDDTQVICWGENINPGQRSTKPSYQQISITPNSIPVKNGDCVSITPYIVNKNNYKSLRENLTILPIDLTNSGTFYQDSNCTYPSTESVLYAGEYNSTEIFYKSNYVGINPITAYLKYSIPNSGTGVGFTSLQLVGLPHHISFADRFYYYNGGCAKIDINLSDSEENLLKANNNYTINFSMDTSTNFKIYSDSSCLNEVTSLMLNSGSTSTSFYTKGFVDCTTSAITLTTPTLISPVTTSTYSIDCSGGGD
jgi:hypothetical protein